MKLKVGNSCRVGYILLMRLNKRYLIPYLSKQKKKILDKQFIYSSNITMEYSFVKILEFFEILKFFVG